MMGAKATAGAAWLFRLWLSRCGADFGRVSLASSDFGSSVCTSITTWKSNSGLNINPGSLQPR